MWGASSCAAREEQTMKIMAGSLSSPDNPKLEFYYNMNFQKNQVGVVEMWG